MPDASGDRDRDDDEQRGHREAPGGLEDLTSAGGIVGATAKVANQGVGLLKTDRRWRSRVHHGTGKE